VLAVEDRQGGTVGVDRREMELVAQVDAVGQRELRDLKNQH
jgi:hypothetical protein